MFKINKTLMLVMSEFAKDHYDVNARILHGIIITLT